MGLISRVSSRTYRLITKKQHSTPVKSSHPSTLVTAVLNIFSSIQIQRFIKNEGKQIRRFLRIFCLLLTSTSFQHLYILPPPCSVFVPAVISSIATTSSCDLASLLPVLGYVAGTRKKQKLLIN